MTINFYVIDSSSLIELNRRYPIDVFPTLWKNMDKLIEKGFLISHKEVLKEISVMDDSLKKWAKKQKKFFKEKQNYPKKKGDRENGSIKFARAFFVWSCGGTPLY